MHGISVVAVKIGRSNWHALWVPIATPSDYCRFDMDSFMTWYRNGYVPCGCLWYPLLWHSTTETVAMAEGGNEQSLYGKQIQHLSHVVFGIDGLVQDCSISIANALEILQSCIDILISNSCWSAACGFYRRWFGTWHVQQHGAVQALATL